MNFSIENKSLDYFGILSGSTLVNNFSLLWIIIIIFTIHLFYLGIYKWLKRKRMKNQKWIKLIEWIYQLFAYTIYLRLILEANQFIMLSSFSELRSWDTSNASKIVSLWIAFIGTLLWISLIILSFLFWLRNKHLENIDHYMPLKVFFCNLKIDDRSRLYSTVLLARRALLVIYLIMGSSIISIGLVVPIMVLQIVYLILILYVRPYKSNTDNALEITNEFFYFIMIALLCYFNEESKWNNTAETVYLWLIIGNSILIISITISKILFWIIQYSFYYNKIDIQS